MKRIILSTFILFTGACSFAQQKLAEGTITYAVEYQLPDNLKPYAAYFPKDATVYFKGDSTISVQKSTGRSTSVVTNNKTSSMAMLLEMQGKQFVVNFTPADLEEIELALPELTYTASAETQTLLNYKAIKYEVKNKADGKMVEDWFTKDVIVPANSLTKTLDASLGTPLIFTTMQSGIIVKVTTKEIKAGPVPAGIFATPKGFEPLTMAQLKAMSGGK